MAGLVKRAKRSWRRLGRSLRHRVREALQRKVKIEGLETVVGRIVVPSERVRTRKEGKVRDSDRKLYPGYVFIELDLDKNGMTMAEAQRRAKEREFGEMNREFQRKQREFREDLNQRRNQELARVVEQANGVIRQIAEQEKFDIIFQEMPAYVSPRIDITDKVIKALEGKPPSK